MIPTAVIIVAGGSGVRHGSCAAQTIPAVERPTILMHTIERFAEALPGCRIILVLPRSRTAYWQTLCEITAFLCSIWFAKGERPASIPCITD